MFLQNRPCSVIASRLHHSSTFSTTVCHIALLSPGGSHHQIAATDPTAYHLHTDATLPGQLTDHLTDLIHAMGQTADERRASLAHT